MDRDFLFGATVDRVPDVFARHAVDRDKLLERIKEDANRPRLAQYERYDRDARPFRRWAWEVVNTTTGEVMAYGRAATKKAAIRRKHRAYCKALAALHTAGGES